MKTAWVVLGLALGLWLSGSAVVYGHALSPASVLIHQRPSGGYRVEVRKPTQSSAQLTLNLPAGCEQRAVARELKKTARVERSELSKDCSLAGQRIALSGLKQTSALLYVRFHNGESVRAVLTADSPSLVVPQRGTSLSVLRSYLGLGVRHLALGLDHLLFLLALLLLAQSGRELLGAVTAFTLAHSITLCLQALSVVQVPEGAAEVAIALSIVLACGEIASGGGRKHLLVWFAFVSGLVHGLGFSGVLRETGLPEQALALSLGAFNLGLELGQLALIGLFLALRPVLRRLPSALRAHGRLVAAYAMGALAAMWCIERLLV